MLVLSMTHLAAQDTFSIVAVDSITGEVGSAGASCVDLFSFPGYATDFLGDLLPGMGAINTQAYYLAGNQANARSRMQAGDTPQQVIDWLVANDVQGNPHIRQYGVVGLVSGSPQAAAFTGMNTDHYKAHVVGSHYSIQGNILLGQEVLDSMEARFLAQQGDLACKLMAALQGAKVLGADTRCASNGTSSLFAFVKVAQPTDPIGNPSFLVSVKTHSGAGIEPIDTLQSLFDAARNCAATAIHPPRPPLLQLHPNPTQDRLALDIHLQAPAPYTITIHDLMGQEVLQAHCGGKAIIDVGSLPPGVYVLTAGQGTQWTARRFVKN